MTRSQNLLELELAYQQQCVFINADVTECNS